VGSPYRSSTSLLPPGFAPGFCIVLHRLEQSLRPRRRLRIAHGRLVRTPSAGVCNIPGMRPVLTHGTAELVPRHVRGEFDVEFHAEGAEPVIDLVTVSPRKNEAVGPPDWEASLQGPEDLIMQIYRLPL